MSLVLDSRFCPRSCSSGQLGGLRYHSGPDDFISQGREGKQNKKVQKEGYQSRMPLFFLVQVHALNAMWRTIPLQTIPWSYLGDLTRQKRFLHCFSIVFFIPVAPRLVDRLEELLLLRGLARPFGLLASVLNKAKRSKMGKPFFVYFFRLN